MSVDKNLKINENKMKIEKGKREEEKGKGKGNYQLVYNAHLMAT